MKSAWPIFPWYNPPPRKADFAALVNTELTVSSTNTINSVSLSNLVGQMVYNKVCNAPSIEGNVVNLPKGVYFVKINGTDVRKFVKE